MRNNTYRASFSLRGELFYIIVEARNYTDAKRLAWADCRDFLNDPDDYARTVLTCCQLTEHRYDANPIRLPMGSRNH